MNAFGRRRLTAEPIGLASPVEAPEAPAPLRVVTTGPLVELRTLCLSRIDPTTAAVMSP